jgi:peroxiredoxin
LLSKEEDMATVIAESLKSRFAELQAWREENWLPAQLEKNASQRRTLVERFDASAIAQAGDTLPPYVFATSEGEKLALDDLVANGPAVLVFFRFANCPACNIALRYYEEALYPALRARGIPLLALSPQIPERLGEIVRHQNLSFPVASDAESIVSRDLGIAFVPDERPVPPPRDWIGQTLGNDRWELPQPTVVIVDKGRRIRWLKTSPDWLDRPEADEILTAIEQS